MISGIILAAGLSKRMGVNKLLLQVRGIPLIEHVISAASSSRLGEVILVCSDECIADIGRAYGAKVINNPKPELGQSKSVRLGVENSNTSAEGYLFMVGDQPLISADIINILMDSYSNSACSAVVPVYNGERGNPVIFSSMMRERLLSLEGDVGGRVLLKELDGSILKVDMPDGAAGFDIDTPEQYESIIGAEDENG